MYIRFVLWLYLTQLLSARGTTKPSIRFGAVIATITWGLGLTSISIILIQAHCKFLRLRPYCGLKPQHDRLELVHKRSCYVSVTEIEDPPHLFLIARRAASLPSSMAGITDIS